MMSEKEIANLVRPNILALRPYSSARDEFSGSEGVFLDANENPFGTLNRYPDPYQKQIKQQLSEYKNVAADQLFIGNGSDEVIDLVFRIFCEPGKDKALCFSPTYGMYEVAANINAVQLITLPLTNEFQIDFAALSPYLNDPNIKLLFICTPNNPTANAILEVEQIIKNFNGIVVVDEAYIDFSQKTSAIALINSYSNLIVLQTFSKAWGLAGARIGVAYTNPFIISLLNKTKPPYNVSTLNQKAVLDALSNTAIFEKNLQTILTERNSLSTELAKLKWVKKVYPSDANFLLVAFDRAQEIFAYLINQKIITRNRTQFVENCLRITIGTPDENKQLIEALQKFDV